VTAETVGAEAVLELLDEVLVFATIVVKGEDLGCTTRTVGDEEAQIGAGGSVLSLVADAALVRPTAGTMAEAGEAALRQLRTTVTSLQPLLPRFGAALEDTVGRGAKGVLDAKELAELIE